MNGKAILLRLPWEQRVIRSCCCLRDDVQWTTTREKEILTISKRENITDKVTCYCEVEAAWIGIIEKNFSEKPTCLARRSSGAIRIDAQAEKCIESNFIGYSLRHGMEFAQA